VLTLLHQMNLLLNRKKRRVLYLLLYLCYIHYHRPSYCFLFDPSGAGEGVVLKVLALEGAKTEAGTMDDGNGCNTNTGGGTILFVSFGLIEGSSDGARSTTYGSTFFWPWDFLTRSACTGWSPSKESKIQSSILLGGVSLFSHANKVCKAVTSLIWLKNSSAIPKRASHSERDDAFFALSEYAMKKCITALHLFEISLFSMSKCWLSHLQALLIFETHQLYLYRDYFGLHSFEIK